MTTFYESIQNENFDKEHTFLNEFKNLLREYDSKSKIGNYPYEDPLDIYKFRRELGLLYKAEKRFCLRRMEDPIEALLAIINAFHSYSLKEKSLKECDKPCNPVCIVHKLFWINIFDQDVSYINYIKD